MDSITANASGDALSISSDTPGVPFTLTTSTTDGGSDNTQTSTAAPSTLNVSGELLTDSGSISYDDLDLTDTSLVTRSFVSATASAGASLSSALDAALQDIDNAFTITGAGIDGGTPDHSGTVNWAFSIDNALTQYLDDGETITVVYRITATDDSGFNSASGSNEINTSTQDITVTITGANDTPLISVGSLQNEAHSFVHKDKVNTLHIWNPDGLRSRPQRHHNRLRRFRHQQLHNNDSFR